MANKNRSKPVKADSYRHEEKRLNNPEAGMIDYAPKTKETKTSYCWDPRESPQLVWAGKAGLKNVEVDEQASLEIPLVNLHIHERVSTEAILRSVRREDAQRSLFADPELEFKDEVKFYQHEVGWSNRMILGDSLLVMNSLVEREAMRGNVQCIYMDPPYGQKYNSNFQPRIDQRDVKDGKDEDLTREVMQVQAFRDTWELEVHSYLTYLRDRLLVARELLSESGSIFVQIGDENVHRVRCLMDEVFGEENFIAQVSFRTKIPLGTKFLAGVADYILWFGQNKEHTKYRRVFDLRATGTGTQFTQIELDSLERRRMNSAEFAALGTEDEEKVLPPNAKVFRLLDLVSAGRTESCVYTFEADGKTFRPSNDKSWKTNSEGMARLAKARRIGTAGNMPGYVFFAEDFNVQGFTNLWVDTQGASDRQYAVQTAEKVIQRCILMTTDPGDLVLDPTCGSGTTAFVAEQWGRRWITCDTSRVALAIARHRLMTAAFDYYTLRHPTSGVSGGFKYKTVPHITLKSIAQNQEIDVIAEAFTPLIRRCLDVMNELAKQSWNEWDLPSQEVVCNYAYSYFDQVWHEAFVPEPVDSVADLDEVLNAYDIGERIQPAYRYFWTLKREMQAKIDASIQRNAPQEELVDQPEKQRGVVRVTGPFTLEAVPNVAEISVNVEERIMDDLQITMFEPVQPSISAVNVNAYIGDMIERLRKSGVNVRGKDSFSVENLRAVAHEQIHAEGDIVIRNGQEKRLSCGVVIGPPNGAISEIHVRDAVNYSRAYDAVLFCGYEFSDAAQEMIREHVPPGKKFYMSYINADTAMGDLLKDSKASQIFTMVGEPDVRVYRFGDPPPKSEGQKDEAERGTLSRFATLREGELFIELRGVDLYDPLTGEVSSDSGANVHAIFIDHDYDGKSFCICQALFPNKKDSWDKISRNLRGTIDVEAFEAFRTTVSLPFRPGANGKVQVKVIDARGNAIVKTVRV